MTNDDGGLDFCLSLNLRIHFTMQTAATHWQRSNESGYEQWDLTLSCNYIIWRDQEKGEGRSLLWQTTRAMNKYGKLIGVWFQVYIPPMENAHTHITSSVFHPPIFLMCVHESTLIVNLQRHPFSPSHSISLLPQFARAHLSPHFRGGVQTCRNFERSRMCHLSLVQTLPYRASSASCWIVKLQQLLL